MVRFFCNRMRRSRGKTVMQSHSPFCAYTQITFPTFLISGIQLLRQLNHISSQSNISFSYYSIFPMNYFITVINTHFSQERNPTNLWFPLIVQICLCKIVSASIYFPRSTIQSYSFLPVINVWNEWGNIFLILLSTLSLLFLKYSLQMFQF